MTAFLPQHDPNAPLRQHSIERGRSQYAWNHDFVSPLAMVERVPVQDEWTFRWMTLVGHRVFHVLDNHLILAHEQDFVTRLRRRFMLFLKRIRYFRLDGQILRRLVSDAIEHTVSIGRPRNLDDYAQLFRSIALPPIHREFTDDRVFASMRVAGPNPLVIQRYRGPDDRFPVDERHFAQACPDDNFEQAAAEGRLYVADYQMLDAVEDGLDGRVGKYVYAPIALFVVDRSNGSLLPVAIQCEQRPSPQNPIFTPRDGTNWLIAKTVVEIADGNLHEAVSHLGRTHLLMEPFVVATGRQLADIHPLKILLRPHFEGTLKINSVAHRSLINPTGVIDQVMGGTIEGTRTLAANGLANFPINRAALPETIRSRGVDDTTSLPNYPYRDDALLLWNAIEQWVSAYLGIYYRTDDDVRQDNELQAWMSDLLHHDGGRVVGFGEDGNRIVTREYLTRTVTLLIYTASVQHAAVNFPQYDLMSYCPNMPLAGYAPAPKSVSGATQQDLLDMLPPLNMADLAMKVLYVLGSVHYTTLGEYESTQFADPRVAAPLREFQSRLNDIRDTIAGRNERRRPYNFLVPSGIPQSINI